MAKSPGQHELLVQQSRRREADAAIGALTAVSKDSNPNDGWYFASLNTSLTRRAPTHLPRHLLFRILAYRLQADRFGDLDADSRTCRCIV